ncbi:MAG: hypothetical protein QOD10_1767, partial [Mycobacterium sp.]|nr:hypothetical protein [Mycobacterium sp.]
LHSGDRGADVRRDTRQQAVARRPAEPDEPHGAIADDQGRRRGAYGATSRHHDLCMPGEPIPLEADRNGRGRN